MRVEEASDVEFFSVSVKKQSLRCGRASSSRVARATVYDPVVGSFSVPLLRCPPDRH